MARKTSRRQLLATGTRVAPGLALVGAVVGQPSSVAAARTDLDGEAAIAVASPAAATPGAVIGHADAPKWTFTVTQFVDPYTGTVTKPRTPPSGMRYLGAEVVIENGSNQPLSFSLSDLMLSDKEGVVYPAGDVIGSEPRLVSQDLPDGERTRGWVWFMVPKDDSVTEIRFVGPSPTFRIPLPSRSGG